MSALTFVFLSGHSPSAPFLPEAKSAPCVAVWAKVKTAEKAKMTNRNDNLRIDFLLEILVFSATTSCVCFLLGCAKSGKSFFRAENLFWEVQLRLKIGF